MDIIQIKNPKSEHYIKINRSNGEILEHKESEGPYEDIPIFDKKCCNNETKKDVAIMKQQEGYNDTETVTITFTFKNDYCGREEAARLMKNNDIFGLLHDVDQECRGFLKYDHDFKNADEAIEHIRNSLWSGGLLEL